MRADLHLHTTASDGRLSPEEIVHLAQSQGLSVIAITDHDTVEGIVPALEAASTPPSLMVIPGVEISTDVPHGEIHILGYFIDYTSNELRDTLARFRKSRQERAQKMIAKLRDLGVRVEWQRVQELAGGASMGRPHLAQAMLEGGYITSLKEAFAKYIGRDGPAYAEREKMTPVEAVELVVRTHGLPVLAHPADINRLESLLPELKSAGLIGIEVYYNGYTMNAMQNLRAIADKYELIPSGGSDYHGLDTEGETRPGEVTVPSESVKRLISLAEGTQARLRAK